MVGFAKKYSIHPIQKVKIKLTYFMIKKLLPFAIIISQLSSVQAAEWTLGSRVNQSMAYDDNIRMQVGKDKRSSFIYEFSPQLNAGYISGNTQLTADVEYGVEVYTNKLETTRQSVNTNVSGSYQTQSVNYGLDVSYNLQPARNTAADDTGNFNSDAAKANLLVSPTIAYMLTEQDTFSGSVQYGQSLYSKGDAIVSGSLTDNSNIGASIAWGHRWSEQYTMTLSSNVSFYLSDGELRKTNNKSYSVTLGNSYQFNERWNVYLDTGYRYTASENTLLGISVSHASQGFLINTALNYTGEVFSSGLGFNQSMNPDGNGQLNQQSIVTLNLSYKLTETISVQASTGYQKTKSVSTFVINNDRSNITVSAALSWKVTPFVFLNANYSYRKQISEQLLNDVTDSPDSNRIMLTLGYNWQGLSLSR